VPILSTVGAKHLFKTIELTKYLPKDQRYLIDVVIQRNGFFEHVVNILISMFDDERRSIRKLLQELLHLGEINLKKSESLQYHI
jgi:hypothetical protein